MPKFKDGQGKQNYWNKKADNLLTLFLLCDTRILVFLSDSGAFVALADAREGPCIAAST